MEYSPNFREKGTNIKVSCSEEEFSNAKNLFLTIMPVPVLSERLGILDAPGKLYLNGVYIQDIISIWGYNFTDKGLANRDRSILNGELVNFKVRDILEKLNTPFLIQELLRLVSVEERKEWIETNLSFYPSAIHHAFWRKAFKHIFGDKACLPGISSGSDNSAKELGWSIPLIPYFIQKALGGSGVLNSTDVLNKLSKGRIKSLSTPLTSLEQSILTDAKFLAKKVIPDTNVTITRVVEDFPTDSLMNCTQGLYKNKIVYLRRECLKDLAIATGVLIHERIHGEGFNDSTRAFENRMTELLGQLSVISWKKG